MSFDHFNSNSVELFEKDIGGSGAPYTIIVKLRPTGKWKIEIDHRGMQTMYIQHKELPFNRWVREDSILYGVEPKTYINNCY